MANARLVELFMQLAAIDGRSGKEAAVAQFANSFLKNLGLSPQMDGANTVSGSNTSNIVCPIGGGGNMALLAHMDTATLTSSTTKVVTADRITSNGKGPLGANARAGMTVILYALERAAMLSLPHKPFTIAFTTQGETSLAGVRNLRLPAGIRYAFVFDSSSDPGCYALSSPGVAGFAAHVTGKPSVSGSDIETGVSAIRIAAKAIAALDTGRHDGETTSNIGIISGGEATNVIPIYTLVRGEVRALDKDKGVPVLNTIKAGFEKAAAADGGKAMFNWAWDFQPYRHDKDSAVGLMAETAVRGAGLQPVPVISQGGSDANSLNGKGITALSFGIGAKNPRTNDEYILLDHLTKASEIAWQLIKA